MPTDDTRAALREQLETEGMISLEPYVPGEPMSKIVQIRLDRLLAMFDRYSSERAISELKQIEPPEQYEEYAKLMGQNYCTICGFDAVKFRKYIQERIEALTPKAKGDTDA